MKKLSIIIPCFNSSDTLEEAVTSIYTQELKDFEIIIVDDGSTDNTRYSIKTLAERHTEIKYIFHDKNKGGGAARNTAIRHSTGEIICCLDSDDMLSPKSLSSMLMLQEKTGADGIAFGRSVKFIGRDTNSISYINNFYRNDQPIEFLSLFDTSKDRSCPLYSTFMHTREAFEIIGGYPEYHGFDTQSFAVRFLCNGLTAYTCKDAEYMHRVKFKESYYKREEVAGKVSLNFYYVYSDFMYIFSEKIKKILLSYKFDDEKNNIKNVLDSCEDKFIENYEKLITKNTKEKYKEKIIQNKDTDPYDAYWLGEQYLLSKEYDKAADLFLRSLKKGLLFPRVYFHTLRAISKDNILDKNWTSDILDADRVYPIKVKKKNLIKRLLIKIKIL